MSLATKLSSLSWGFSYSPHQAASVGLEPLRSFEQALSWRPTYVRLGCYWTELSPQPDTLDLSSLLPYLELCQEHRVSVVLTLGLKAPRWPEFYWPEWLPTQDWSALHPYLLAYLSRLVTSLSQYACISHWQVENEPLDPSGPDNLAIPVGLLTEEVTLVRSLDSRPLLLTLWGNSLSKRGHLTVLSELADIIGLDLYYQQHLRPTLPWQTVQYGRPQDTPEQLQSSLAKINKPIWITELQAEPWEPHHTDYLQDQTPGFSTTSIQDNLQEVLTLQPETVLFWGVEWWLLHHLDPIQL